MKEEYKPFTPEETYKVVLSKDETLLIQKIREIGYGSITVHLINHRIVRTDENISELTKDRKKETVTIAIVEAV